MTTLTHRDTLAAVVPTLAIERACDGIAPAWPLDRAIAVNPLNGITDRPFERVAAELAATTGARLLPSRELLAELWHQGRFRREHLLAALRETRAQGDGDAEAELAARADALQRALLEPSPEVRRLPLLTDFADAERPAPGGAWSVAIVEQIAAYLADRFDRDAEVLPAAEAPGLYRGWLAALAKTPGRLGGAPYRDWLARLPQEPHAALEHCVTHLGLDADLLLRADYFGALLASVRGWAATCAWRRFEARTRGGDDPALFELLVIRLAWECLIVDALALHTTLPRFRQALADHPERVRAVHALQAPERVLLRALEHAYQSELVHQLVFTAPQAMPPRTAPASEVAAVFCIDVRSERLRRALEHHSDGHVTTHGFAGFFGLPIASTPLGSEAPRPRLPGLLAPQHRTTESGFDAPHDEQLARTRRTRLGWRRLWQSFRTGPGSAFTYVETCGLASLGALVGELLCRHPSERPEHAGLRATERRLLRPSWGAEAPPVAVRAELAARALRGMGLPRELPPLVVFVGHGSSNRNNAHAAMLDCGACGGHSGESNARLLALTLAEPQVRAALATFGIHVPEPTRFVAALHDTTTDEVTVFDDDTGDGHVDGRCTRLRGWLAKAGSAVRRERAPGLGLAELGDHPQALRRALHRRAGDWGQVRPEWGLADNAALVFGPRKRTRHAHLAGRVFLHDYDAEKDKDGALLTQLLSAPMQVASWINLQYFASVVDPLAFGAGNKRLHDVVGGGIGVREGRAGDLRIGLPWQSVHDGTSFRHTPLRLSVFIAADKARIEDALAASEPARRLVANGWLHLFRLDALNRSWRRSADGEWERMP